MNKMRGRSEYMTRVRLPLAAAKMNSLMTLISLFVAWRRRGFFFCDPCVPHKV